jgi:anti-sigma B factor antagonist
MGTEITVGRLQLSTVDHGHYTIVTIGGEIDHYSVPGLRVLFLALAQRGRHHLIIDLEAVDFLDSSGLGVLVGALKRSRAGDGSYHVVCTSERLLAMFRITGLDRAMEIRESVDQALANQDQCS